MLKGGSRQSAVGSRQSAVGRAQPSLRDGIVALLCEPALHGLDLRMTAVQLVLAIDARGEATARACGPELARLKSALEEAGRDA